MLQSSALQQYSGYKPSDLKECVLIIQELQLRKRGSSLMAIREKYAHRQVHMWYLALISLTIALNIYVCEDGDLIYHALVWNS